MKMYVALISGLLIASPAFGQAVGGPLGSGQELATQSDPAETTNETARATGDERVICRNLESDSSTRRPRRVCRTAQQWREAQRAH